MSEEEYAKQNEFIVLIGIVLGLLIISATGVLIVNTCDAPEELTPTLTYTALPPSMTPTDQATYTPTATNSPTVTPSPTYSPTATNTERPPTDTPTATNTPRPRVTAIVLPTDTPQPPDDLPVTGGQFPDD